MKKEQFVEKLKTQCKKIDIIIDEKQCNQLYLYMKLLLEWNEKINLTAITDENDIIIKHFIDSLTIFNYIDSNSKLIDVGTGAGFPGIPLKIIGDSLNITLLDALNKRLNFINDVIEKNELSNIQTIHYRAEDAGKNKIYREKFDIATSRAVAPLNILSEYLLPFVKIGGKCICMKGSNVKEEIEEAKKAIKTLGGEIESINEFYLPDTDIARTIIVIRKISSTPKEYPRKAGTPNKNPII